MKLYASLCIGALLFAGACKPKTQNNQPANPAVDTQQTTPAPVEPPAEQPADSLPRQERMVQITTDLGTIVIELYNETPHHRDNFIKLVKSGYYNKLLFHRIIAEFMIQGGDPDSKNAAPGQQLGGGDIGYTIPAEFNPNLIHKRGALAAARQGDQVNPQKRSSGCQFYIVQGKKNSPAEIQQMSAGSGIKYTPEQINTYTTMGGVPFLDMNYTVFGEVVSGMDVVDKIAAQPKDQFDRPMKDIKFTMQMAGNGTSKNK